MQQKTKGGSLCYLEEHAYSFEKRELKNISRCPFAYSQSSHRVYTHRGNKSKLT
jgi:hypothetical protein